MRTNITEILIKAQQFSLKNKKYNLQIVAYFTRPQCVDYNAKAWRQLLRHECGYCLR